MSDTHKQKIIVRFPPSPTGLLHVGSVRTALFNYLFAKQNGGDFILRIEDTDKERSTKEFEQDIFNGLSWLGIVHDNQTVIRQSERGEVYKTYLQQLIDSGKAYISKEEIKDENSRPEVIRFKNPNKKVTFNDMIRGDITFDTTELGDFVIAKSLTEPLYHLAVVVDDFDSKVTHIIRGEDGISNTPRQILIQEALNAPMPQYAHLPLILASDRSKLSKRKHGERVSLRYYKEQGFLKEALINYIALIGWNPGSTEELFTLEELVQKFDLHKVQKGGAIFDEEKLRWMNKEYLKKLSPETLLEYISNMSPEITKLSQEKKLKLITLTTERSLTFGDIKKSFAEGEWAYLFSKPEYKKESLIWKKSTLEEALKHLKYTAEVLEKTPEKIFETAETIKEVLWSYAEREGKGDVLWPLRFSLSGREKSPDPFTLLSFFGKEEGLSRIKQALS